MSLVDVGVPVVYWFRSDMRLQDNLAWTRACAMGRPVLAVTSAPVLSASEVAWGIPGLSPSRKAWWAATVQELRRELDALGVSLLVLRGGSMEALVRLFEASGAVALVCEEIAAPYEKAQLSSLRASGIVVHSVWQSTLFEAEDLPFSVTDLPGVFTRFRSEVERAKVPFRTPLPAPVEVTGYDLASDTVTFVEDFADGVDAGKFVADPRSAFQWRSGSFDADDEVLHLDEVLAGSGGGHAYLQRYLESGRVAQYKATRNGLTGMAYSSKWSPWLALGAVSAPEMMAALKAHERNHGATDGSYWLWFELLWRDYFRWLHLQYGAGLYHPKGLLEAAKSERVPHHRRSFTLWTQGRTGCDLVDAGMRELACSGYLSNRMRQVVASFLIYELGCDWRAGAAWFESQLLDFDVYSNQGNWLYIAGLGTDPRGGRRFNVAKQTADHDPDGAYRALWSARS